SLDLLAGLPQLTSNQNPTPKLDDNSLLAPIATNIDRIIPEISPHGSTGKTAPPQHIKTYAGAHMSFADALDDQLGNRLTHSPAVPYLWQLSELITNILPDGPQEYTLLPPNPRSFSTLYAPPPIRSAEQALHIWAEPMKLDKHITL
ncbi:hypothetical protein O181_118426, partial [Austropuccinia psidii MF-1]|nr:hypothetical protein [Austropuccinia psidii MF-1]